MKPQSTRFFRKGNFEKRDAQKACEEGKNVSLNCKFRILRKKIMMDCTEVSGQEMGYDYYRSGGLRSKVWRLAPVGLGNGGG